VRRPAIPRNPLTVTVVLACALLPPLLTAALLAREDEPAPAAPAAPAEASRPGIDVPDPVALPQSKPTAVWAPVVRSVAALAAPSPDAARVTTLETTTPEGTSNLVLVLARRRDDTGRLWAQVRLPVLPNGTVAWVPRTALGGNRAVRTRLVVDTEALKLTLLRGGRRVLRADIGVGAPDWPTPTGEFYIRNKLTKYRSAFYGPLAFGTSARSAVLTDWPAGGHIGIHGTDRPDLLPGRVSHGCIRMRNADVVRLARLMPIGTPVTIR
jgi:lipoprotein-anchoring transpeptidase ErfK/SrfK